MNYAAMNARTVSIVQELTTKTVNGANGQYENTSIMFRIAVEDGGRKAIFWTAKAYGAVAQTFDKYCNQKKENGKLVSRHLTLQGYFTNYETTRTVKRKGMAHVTIPGVSIDGKLYDVSDYREVELDEEEEKVPNVIFVVEKIDFLDPKPDTQAQTPGAVSNTPIVVPVNATAAPQTVAVTPQAVSAPVQVAQPAPMPVQPNPMTAAVSAMSNIAAQQVVTPASVAQPVQVIQPAQPVQVVQPTTVAQPVQQATPVAEAPVVNSNFVPTGETAPF